MTKRTKSGLVLLDREPAKRPPPDATVALFAYADVKPNTVDCLIRDLRTWPNLVYYRISNDALISRSRSRVASDFLRSQPELVGDVLLMIDHDMCWRDGDLQYIAEKAIKTRGVVAGVYPKRGFGLGAAVRFGAEGEYTVGEDQTVEAIYVSTGFMAIHRSVLEAIAKELPYTIGNFWPFFLEIVVQHPLDDNAQEFLSEDWAFCVRAREAGFKVYAAMKPRLEHIGEHAYRMVDSQFTPPADAAITFRVAATVEAPAIKWLLRDAAEFTGIAPDQMNEAIGTGRAGLGMLWTQEGSFEPDKEIEWYKREDVGRHYVLDLAGWHFQNIGPFLSESLAGIEGKRVLDFGSGIGTMALMLAMQGNTVECVEVNSELRKFTEFRMEKHLGRGNGAGPPMYFVDEPNQLYDLIVFWHVAEHVSDPEGLLAELVSHLAPDGVMFTQSDFHRDSVHTMHHERETDWEEALLAAGLKPIEGRPWYYGHI